MPHEARAPFWPEKADIHRLCPWLALIVPSIVTLSICSYRADYLTALIPTLGTKTRSNFIVNAPCNRIATALQRRVRLDYFFQFVQYKLNTATFVGLYR